MKIGFAIMLSNEAHNFIRNTQLDLHLQVGTGLARQAPHITIKSPFDIEDITPYQKYLHQLSQSIQPFEVRCQGFGHFGQNVLFLDVAENEELKALHWRILNELEVKFGQKPHQFEGENVKFHASIAGFNQPDLFEKANSFLSGQEPDFTFMAKTFGLFYYLGSGNGWIVNSRYDLLPT